MMLKHMLPGFRLVARLLYCVLAIFFYIFIKDATESSVEEFARILGSFTKTEQGVLGFIIFRINFTEVM